MSTLPVKENVNIEEILAQMANWQHTHGIEDNVRHEENIKKFDLIGLTLHEIKTNHLRHIQDNTESLSKEISNINTKQTEMQVKQVENSTNMTWIKWLLMGVTAGMGGLLITLIAALLLR